MQNREYRARITRLRGSKTTQVLFACKTATSGPEKQVSMGPRQDLSFCACTTMCLASQILVSIGPCPHLWILIAKERLLVMNYKSLLVPDLTCRFVQAKRRD